MTDVINILYRLFAPLFVVIVIIVGVDLGADLVKNSQERQSAISIAYASGCPSGDIKAPDVCNKPGRDRSKNETDGFVCNVQTDKAGTIVSTCLGYCCKAQGWRSAEQQSRGDTGANKGTGANSGNPLKDPSLISTVGQALNSLMGMMSGGGSSDSPDDTPKPPVCTSLSTSSTLPLRDGESATLTWILDGGKPDSVIITPGIGAVNGFSVRVTPRISTTYTVVAKNEGGTSTCPPARVYVGPREDGDDIFSSDTQGNYGDVDIWSSGTAGGAQNSNPNSAYDNLWGDGDKPGGGLQGIDDEDDYYDFLNSLATAYDNNVPLLSAQQGGEYYYGDDDDIDWSDFVGDSPYWDNVDLQDNQDYPTDTLGYYEARSGNTFVQGSGLTDEEMYGVWNRPRSPSTGGLGPSGGYDDVSTWDEGDDDSALTRFSKWLKSIFCFWCSPTV